MKALFKDHSYDMVKLFLNQFAVAIFGFVLALATAQIVALRTVCSVLSILFYLFLLYTVAWEMGYKDRGPVLHGTKNTPMATGLYVSLFAQIPNYLFAIFILLATLLNSPVISAIAGVCAPAALFVEGMYTGLLALKVGAEAIPLNAMPFMYFLIPIPAVIVTSVAYVLGRKDITKTRLFRPDTPLSDREPKH